MSVPVRVWRARRLWLVALAVCAMLGVSGARAQGHGGMGHGGGFGGMSGADFRDHSPAGMSAGTGRAETRAGLRLVPAGRWWDDDRFVQTLGLNASQQKHLDKVFGNNRANLLNLYKGLDHELGQLDKLGRAHSPDEGQIDAQIDRVNQARSDLEKGLAHVQLEMRKELTPDQTAKIDDLRSAAPAPPPAEPAAQTVPAQQPE